MLKDVQAALARAIDFTGRRQDRTGAWYDFALGTGYGTCWPTAFVGYHLAGVRVTDTLGYAVSAQLARARLWLLSHQAPTGGWGFSDRLPADADSTAIGLLFLSAMDAPELPALAGRALPLVYQHENGGVSTYNPESIRDVAGTDPFFPGTVNDYAGWTSPTVSVSAAMCLAWDACSADAGQIRGAIAFLLAHQDPEGMWRDYWWLQPHYPTYIAAGALKRLGHGDEQLSLARRWLEKTQASDGGWPLEPTICNAFATALSVCTLLLISPDSPDAALNGVRWLLDHQDPDGGFPPGAMMTVPPPNMTAPPAGLGRLLLPNLLDDQRLFTTAAAVGAFSDYLRHSR